MLCPCSSYLEKTTNTPTLNGGDRGGVRILLFSEITLLKNNVSTILSPIVGSRAPRATRQQSNKATRATRQQGQQGQQGNRANQGNQGNKATMATGQQNNKATRATG